MGVVTNDIVQGTPQPLLIEARMTREGFLCYESTLETGLMQVLVLLRTDELNTSKPFYGISRQTQKPHIQCPKSDMIQSLSMKHC